MFLYLNILISTLFYHPVHLSVANIDYIQEDNHLAIHLRVDKNDMNLAIFHNYQDTLNMATESIDSVAMDYLKKYLGENLTINVNDSLAVKLNMLDYSFEKEEIWFDFCGKINACVEKIEVYNAIFTDLYFDQKNLVIIRSPDVEKGMYFDYEVRSNSLLMNCSK